MIPGHELVAPNDATIVKRLQAAGAVIIGQTNMPDFAASDTNRSTAFGRTGNAYDVRFSPGGSSGGTVTAVTANLAMLGNGTDTGNSIRMPSATSAVVGVLPTRGLVSIAGIAPLDWLLDNTGPIARNVTDAAIALDVMAGPDPLDPRTADASARAQPGPYTHYLKADALKGKRFGVPAFIMHGAGMPFQGIPRSAAEQVAAQEDGEAVMPLQPETREAFMKAIEGLRAAGPRLSSTIRSFPTALPCRRPRGYGPLYPRRHREVSAALRARRISLVAEYEKAVGSPLPSVIRRNRAGRRSRACGDAANSRGGSGGRGELLRPAAKALDAYDEVFDRLHLDGFVYPATQMPPPDETMPQDGRFSGGPHSATGWVNMIGVPAVVVPGGFYATGLPFGLEISARPWKDGDLLGWAYAYEQATKHRRPPVLVDRGPLRTTATK